jgi:hypothetical protein
LVDQLNAHHIFKASLEIRKLTMNSISVLSLGIPSNEPYLLGFPSSPWSHPPLSNFGNFQAFVYIYIYIYIYILGTCNQKKKWNVTSRLPFLFFLHLLVVIFLMDRNILKHLVAPFSKWKTSIKGLISHFHFFSEFKHNKLKKVEFETGDNNQHWRPNMFCTTFKNPRN